MLLNEDFIAEFVSIGQSVRDMGGELKDMSMKNMFSLL